MAANWCSSSSSPSESLLQGSVCSLYWISWTDCCQPAIYFFSVPSGDCIIFWTPSQNGRFKRQNTSLSHRQWLANCLLFDFIVVNAIIADPGLFLTSHWFMQITTASFVPVACFLFDWKTQVSRCLLLLHINWHLSLRLCVRRWHRMVVVWHVRFPPGPDLPHCRGEGHGCGPGRLRGGEEGSSGEEGLVGWLSGWWWWVKTLLIGADCSEGEGGNSTVKCLGSGSLCVLLCLVSAFCIIAL